MTLDDLPLVDLEKEVFAECGAWKNFPDLEDSLTLEELSELYEITIERQNRFHKILGAAFGMDLQEDSSMASKGEDDWMKPAAERYLITGKEDLAGFEYGLGYETVSGSE